MIEACDIQLAHNICERRHFGSRTEVSNLRVSGGFVDYVNEVVNKMRVYIKPRSLSFGFTICSHQTLAALLNRVDLDLGHCSVIDSCTPLEIS